MGNKQHRCRVSGGGLLLQVDQKRGVTSKNAKVKVVLWKVAYKCNEDTF